MDYVGGVIGYLLLILYIGLLLIVTARIVFKRRAVGVTLAWLGLILSLPILGIIMYLVLGELQLGRYRAKRARRLQGLYREWLDTTRSQLGNALIDSKSGSRYDAIHRLIDRREGMPLTGGNSIELKSYPNCFFDGLINDIDEATKTIWLEFYIVDAAGAVEFVLNALERAVDRGVEVRLAVDSAGSRGFLSSDRYKALKRRGVRIVELLPVLPWRIWIERQDLRVHRKIIVIDGRIGWTGSMNLADPSMFNADAGVGQWIDSMIRVEGPVVLYLKSVILFDWQLETGRDLLPRLQQLEISTSRGSGQCQVAPSGPANPEASIEEVLLSALYSAETSIKMTTPYFVPGDSLIAALKAAAHRGVEVDLVVPAKNDSKLAGYAGRSYYEELMQAGVRIHEFNQGLLHSKIVLLDQKIALYGSVNLDMRSFWLNFEITVVLYDRSATASLDALIEQYLESSNAIDLEVWRRRFIGKKLFEQIAYLASPLL